KVIELTEDEFSDRKSDAEYFIALCAVKLFNRDAEYLLSRFISLHPESPRMKTACYQMGNYQFRNNKYRKALKWFRQVDIYDLTKEEKAEYYFKTGYSYFMMDDYQNAGKAFYEIKDIDTKYTVYAIYYYSHIEYLNGNYQTALEGFQRLSENEMFSPIVPYYITQIYFYQKRYDDIIAYAPPLVDSASTKRAPEIARIIAEAYYRTFKYEEAIPYLELFMDNSKIITREDYYKMAYCYYRNKEYNKAARKFASIANTSDVLAQNSYYHLADCYLKNGDKHKARYAFLSAADMKNDAVISENSLFNYAKLSYELSMYPFNEALKAFSEFIDKYPDSPLVDDAHSYMVKVFLTTRNYKDAVESLESIENITPEIGLIYQRVTYFRGLELFNDKDFEEAIINFDKSLNNVKTEPVIKAQSYYWKGESYYRLNRYREAVESYGKFVLSDGAFELPVYKIAHYNMGYADFKLKNYEEAITEFRKYLRFLGDERGMLFCDASNRVGDCYFILKKYEDAIIYYQDVIDAGKLDADYALFQKGLVKGLLKDYNQKVIALNQLLNDYPKSSHRPAALYELAKSYVMIETPEMAVSTYQMIIDECPSSIYVKKSYMNLALIHYNNEDNEKALEAYKTVVKNFWGQAEIEDALQEIERIYMDMSNVDGYVEYRNSIGHSVDQAKQDS
ncbi:MAG: tetratricopeptide repeat protein, partial [Bacteroidetes bacterium]|nr:tetratricopeptide repeat protein [Bacteroidota bacterium]